MRDILAVIIITKKKKKKKLNEDCHILMAECMVFREAMMIMI